MHSEGREQSNSHGTAENQDWFLTLSIAYPIRNRQLKNVKWFACSNDIQFLILPLRLVLYTRFIFLVPMDDSENDLILRCLDR